MKKARLEKNSKLIQGIEIQHDKKTSIRLNKYISDTGYASRREADRLVEAGKVYVDGIVAQIGMQIFPHQTVYIDGNLISKNTQRIYIALNKPRGIISTTDRKIEGNVIDFMDYPETIFPIGRLDKDSSGLLLLTNDGDVVNKILREENGHDKLYEVQVDQVFSKDFIQSLQEGVKIYNPVTNQYQTTRKCKVEVIDSRSFYITLQQGLNRQIRRMTKALGYHVSKLKRVRVMHIQLGDLKEGEYRYLNEKELLEMNQRLQDSY